MAELLVIICCVHLGIVVMGKSIMLEAYVFSVGLMNCLMISAMLNAQEPNYKKTYCYIYE